MNANSFVSINDISKEKIIELLESAKRFEENPNQDLLLGRS